MKTIKIIATTLTPLLILFVAFALMGCEDDPGTAVGDAGGVGTLEEGTSRPGGIEILPGEIKITQVGQKIEVEAKGGHWPYTWSVTLATGTINVMQNGPADERFTAVYESTSIGANTIVVEDSAGRTGTREVTTPTSELTVVSDISISTNNNSTIDFIAAGGVPPYTWNIALSNLEADGVLAVSGVGNNTARYVGAGAAFVGENNIIAVDSLGETATATITYE